MPRSRSPDREKAMALYMEHKGEIRLSDIADILNLSEGTIRGWKAKDAWDDTLNGTLRIKKTTERSKRDTERSNQNRKKASIKDIRKKQHDTISENIEMETNSPSPFARFGNTNAAGNKGGPGGPIRNKHALTTGEFETIFFADIIDEEERAILGADYDKYIMQYILIDTLTIREKRILKRIRETENTPGGMVFDSITKNKGSQTTRFVNRNKDGEQWDGNDMILNNDNNTHFAKPVILRVMQMEDALTRVQARKQAAIAQLHRMEMDDERLQLDTAKLELYRQRLSGRMDLDALLGDDDWELDLGD